MKTLLVLSALAALALAAPAPYDNGFAVNQVPATQDKVFVTVKRERKSITDTLEKEATPEVNHTPLQIEDSIAETSARTLGLKKPIIVKKKHGYHLYRDSAEEQAQADSQEKCMKEVKVKLCDAGNNLKPSAKSIIEDVDDMDMEQSIKMAKEAVESLQKGFKDMEHGAIAKMSQWKHADGKKDAEIHADIEVARQALEHIQQNFGHLESMNLRATTLKDAEALDDAQKTNPDDQRMAQWKEATENIQKNVEIARNIEDSFKTESHLGKNTPETSMKSNDAINVNKHELHNEMTVSASEPKESKLEVHNVNDKEKSAATNFVVQAKSEELPLNTLSSAVEMKMNEVPKEGKTAELPSSSHASENTINEKLTSADMHMLQMIDSLTAQGLQTAKSTDNLEPNKDGAIKEWKGDFSDMHLKQEKSALKETEDKTMLPKSNENIPILDSNKKLQSKSETEVKNTEPLMKSVEHLDKEQDQKEFINSAVNSHHKNEAQMAISTKSADQEAHQSQQVNSVTPDMESIEPSRPEHQTAQTMKASEHGLSSSLHEHSGNMVPLTTGSQVNNQMRVNTMESNPIIAKQTHQLSSSHLHKHSGNMSPLTAGSQVNNQMRVNMMESNSNIAEKTHQPSSSHLVVPTGHPISKTDENMTIHGKSADMDSAVQATSQMNIKDTTGKMALEQNNMLQWKHHQGAARGAYGPGAFGAGTGGLSLGAAAASGLSLGAATASGPGAIGVFPKAHLGRSAIPLLLSCSPKVVSGSLAAAHSHAYGPASAAGAYRAGEDFKFHSKRDILKSNVSSTKVKRTPTKVIQKIPNNLDKKL